MLVGVVGRSRKKGIDCEVGVVLYLVESSFLWEIDWKITKSNGGTLNSKAQTSLT